MSGRSPRVGARLGESLALVRREWREVRTVTLATFALIAVACVVVRWVLGAQFDEWTGPEWAGTAIDVPTAHRYLDGFVPAAAALVGALVASDLVAGEIATRKIDALALLPVRASRVWRAKFAVLAGVLVVTALWAIVVQTCTLAAIDGWAYAEPFVSGLADESLSAAVVAAFVASVLLLSSLGVRGLGAALGGLLVFVGCSIGGVAAIQTLMGRSTFGSPPQQLQTVGFTALAIAFVVASASAFSWGRVHLGRVRAVRVAVGATAAIGLIATGAWAGVTSQAGPGSWMSSMDATLHVSPDGRHVAAQWWNELGSGASVRVLDLTTGRWAEMDAPGARVRAWTAPGRLSVLHLDAGATIATSSCDADTGAVLATTTQTVAAYCDEERRRQRELRDAERPQRPAALWNVASRPEDAALWRIYAQGRPHRDVHSVMRPCVLGGANPRVLLAPDADHLVRLDPESGASEPVLTAPGTFERGVITNWGGTRAVLRTPTRRAMIDLGNSTLAPLADDVADAGWPVDGLRGRIWNMRLRDVRVGVLVDVAGGARVALPTARGSEPRIASLPDGGVVVICEDGTAERFGPSLERIPFTGAPARQELPR